MSQIMTECSHSHDGFPVTVFLVVRVCRRKDLAEASGGSTVLGPGKNIENVACDLHHAEGVLKAFVGRCRVNEPGQRELMNMPEALKRSRIDDLSLVRPDDHERVDGIAELVVLLRHRVDGNKN